MAQTTIDALHNTFVADTQAAADKGAALAKAQADAAAATQAAADAKAAYGTGLQQVGAFVTPNPDPAKPGTFVVDVSDNKGGFTTIIGAGAGAPVTLPDPAPATGAPANP